MKRIRLLLLLSLFTFIYLKTTAQDDSAFAQIYRTVRTMTDSLKTYSLYLVPFESADKIKLGTIYQKRLFEVFHFLKKEKQMSFENPDFVIGFLVDSQSLYTPNGKGGSSYSGGGNGRLKFSSATHIFHFTVLIHTKRNQQYSFRLGDPVYVTKNITESPTYAFNNQIKDSITKNRRPENQGYLLSGTTTIQSSSLLDKRLVPDIEDYKSQLIKVFRQFSNKYVDKVYN